MAVKLPLLKLEIIHIKMKTPDLEVEDLKLLKSFIDEFFPLKELFKVGYFTKEMKGDYPAMAKRICDYFGYKTVYEYGSKEIRCHVSYAGGRPQHINENGELKEEPFITLIPNIYE